jgi:hypothetical protein
MANKSENKTKNSNPTRSFEQWKQEYLPELAKDCEKNNLQQDTGRLGQILASKSIEQLMQSH